MSDARIGLYRACADAAAQDPASDVAQGLVRRWQAILEAECGSDPESVREQIETWRSRRVWTPAMLRYVASCYAMDADIWQRAADFLESAFDQSHAGLAR